MLLRQSRTLLRQCCWCGRGLTMTSRLRTYNIQYSCERTWLSNSRRCQLAPVSRSRPCQSRRRSAILCSLVRRFFTLRRVCTTYGRHTVCYGPTQLRNVSYGLRTKPTSFILPKETIIAILQHFHKNEYY